MQFSDVWMEEEFPHGRKETLFSNDVAIPSELWWKILFFAAERDCGENTCQVGGEVWLAGLVENA